MDFAKLARPFAPVFAIAAAGALSACGDVTVDYETDGVPLAELDMSGAAPTGIVLAGSDNVTVTVGEEFTVDVTGSDDIADSLRFSLEDGTLVIHREDGFGGNGSADVNVTLPELESLVVAGSGTLSSDALGENVTTVMAGSGTIRANALAADSLDVVITGSGTVAANGTVERLSINIVGSGDAEMEGLQAERADANIIGSGDAVFSSDGRVEANFVGSGDVRVIGSATCEANTVGSGSLTCEEA